MKNFKIFTFLLAIIACFTAEAQTVIKPYRFDTADTSPGSAIFIVAKTAPQPMRDVSVKYYKLSDPWVINTIPNLTMAEAESIVDKTRCSKIFKSWIERYSTMGELLNDTTLTQVLHPDAAAFTSSLTTEYTQPTTSRQKLTVMYLYGNAPIEESDYDRGLSDFLFDARITLRYEGSVGIMTVNPYSYNESKVEQIQEKLSQAGYVWEHNTDAGMVYRWGEKFNPAWVNKSYLAFLAAAK